MIAVGNCFALLQRGRVSVYSMNESHYLYIRDELNQARGLIPLLMKRRNGGQWNIEERANLLRDLRTLSGLSPYLIPILTLCGIFMYPLVVCWMDRLRNQRKIQISKNRPDNLTLCMVNMSQTRIRDVNAK